MKRLLFLFSAFFVGWLFPSEAEASKISLNLDASTSWQNNRIAMEVRITNKGDESAHNLKIEANSGACKVVSSIKESLAPEATSSIALDLGTAPGLHGKYSVTAKVHYTDANGYPSSAIVAMPVLVGDPESLKQDLSATIKPSKISRQGATTLEISNSATNSIDAKITLILPDELACPAPAQQAIIVPCANTLSKFTLNNISALPGSSYAIAAIIDYSDGTFHHSVISTGSIGIETPLFLGNIPWLIIIALLAIATAVLHFTRNRDIPSDPSASQKQNRFNTLSDILILAILLGFILYHIPPKYLLMDTITTGGDTPAHNYMAGHLKEQLLHHGRIVSWANGWWCGFPMFQYYFCLPYLAIALLSLAIPFNIAFKLVSVSGILGLPVAAYLTGRMLRLPRPAPILLAIAMIPFLFVRAHTMWGANIYSTLAGMISNSISFALMLLFIGSAWRDADDGRFRIRTVLILTALIASHFFTSLIGGLCATILPFLRPTAGMRKAFKVLAVEALLALGLMAWWIIPLLAKQEYSMEFGTNWNITLIKTIPYYWLIPLLLLAIVAIVPAITRRMTIVAVFLWMLCSSLVLFYSGFNHISQVFVNVRMWPFIFFALIALAATGAGILLAPLRFNQPAIAAIMLFALKFGIDTPNDVRSWAKWNYEGAESKPRWQVFEELVKPLDGTPGRLANDLHEHNHMLGSTRIFECVPHVINKPILEGGLVNSAAGSMFSYYIQGETSKNCAGFPTLVTPTGFNITNATKHLELFNVKHFIARWPETQKAMSESKDWQFIKQSQEWKLFELATHSGNYVCIPKYFPAAIRINDAGWKMAALDWIYTSRLLDQPFVLLRNGDDNIETFNTVLNSDEFHTLAESIRNGQSSSSPTQPISGINNPISREEITDNTISFHTTAIGLPHLIKCTYFPNWKVKGAKKIFMVTPCFMLVYPDQEKVELYYGYTVSDIIGKVISLSTLMILAAPFVRAWRRRRVS